MNIEVKNLKANEWITTDDKGRMHFIKADAKSIEMADILNKENELELLKENKEEVLETINGINKSMRQNKRLSISALLVFIMLIGAFTTILEPFSVWTAGNIFSLVAWLGSLTFIEGYIFHCHKRDKKELTICEETLKKIKERKPELEKEIENLKEKYNFREEVIEVNYFEDLRYENREEKGLVRTKIRK